MADPAPPLNYFNNVWAVLSCVNLMILVNGLLCVGIVGLNRLSAIPVVITAAAALADGLSWYAWESHYNKPAKMGAASVAYACWTVREIGVMFYSYFILERILRDWQRRTFLIIFWLLVTTTFIVRVVTSAICVIAMRSDAANQRWTPLISHLSSTYFSTTAATEILSAFFLIKTFNSARKRSSNYCAGSKAGLFRQLLLSSEIRVATLASVGIIRAGVMRQKGKVLLAVQFDMLAVIMLEMFPVVLIMDQFATRIAQLESQVTPDLPSEVIVGGVAAGRNGSVSDSAGSGQVVKRTSGKVVMTQDTIERDFKEYMSPQVGEKPLTP